MQVMLAPVPCIHLESVGGNPKLNARVAFGTSRSGVDQFPIGIPVFIYASQPPHAFFRPGVASWSGTLGAIVKAVERGVRSGKHPDPSVRPATAEATDGPFIAFWEVLNLRQLSPPCPLSHFVKVGGGKPFEGDVPQWPVLTEFDPVAGPGPYGATPVQ